MFIMNIFILDCVVFAAAENTAVRKDKLCCTGGATLFSLC